MRLMKSTQANRTISIKSFLPLLLALLILSKPSYSQDLRQLIERLKDTLPKVESDSMKSIFESQLSYCYKSIDTDSAVYFGNLGLGTARKLDSKLLQINARNSLGLAFMRAANYDSSLFHFNKAIESTKEIDNLSLLSILYNNAGIVYKYKGDYETAISYYSEGLKIDEETGYEPGLSAKHTNIALIYFQLENYEKSLEHDSISLEIKLRGDDYEATSIGYNNLGNTLSTIGLNEEARENYLMALEYSRKSSSKVEISRNLHNLGRLNLDMEQLAEVEAYLNEALELRKEINDQFAIAETHIQLGRCFSNKLNSSKSHYHLKLAKTILDSINSPALLSEYYQVKAEAFTRESDFEGAYYAYQQYHIIEDSLENSKIQERLNLIREKYDSEKKDREILEQQVILAENEKEIQQKKTVNRLLIAGISGAIMILVFLLYIFRQRRKLHLEELSNLEKEKKLGNLRALMEGEEKERMRLARELHDGINGSLAAIKSMTGAEKDSTQSDLGRVGQMIDEVSDEVRDISHNLMPAVLNRSGFVEAVNDFVQKINKQNGLEIEFNTFGDFDTLSDPFKLTVYRIIQELLKNVLKHAEATECLLQLVSRDQQISITIEDNGKGFDTEFTLKAKNNGIGLPNLVNRVEVNGGTIDIESDNKNGTSINIELPIGEQA